MRVPILLKLINILMQTSYIILLMITITKILCNMPRVDFRLNII